MTAFLFPLISAVAHSADVLIDRFIMTRQRLGHRQFTIVMFLGLYFWSSLSTILLGGIAADAFTSRYLWELLAVIAIASLYNMLYYQGIEKKHVEEFEPFLVYSPLAIILVAALVYPTERNPIIFFAAVVAALAVALPYYRHHKVAWDVYQWRLAAYVILSAIEAVLIKDLLSVYSPASLYAVRTGLILTALVAFYTLARPIPLVVISKTHIKEIGLLAILPVIQMIAMYYAFEELGIILSMLLFLVYPVFSYTGARLLLKEKLHWKFIASGAVVVGSVAFAVANL